jgi:hypothetical protein
MSTERLSNLLRLRVVAEADPIAIARVLDPFQNSNVVPRRFIAEFGADRILHIEVDVIGLSEQQVALITRKIAEAPSVINAYWRRL